MRSSHAKQGDSTPRPRRTLGRQAISGAGVLVLLAVATRRALPVATRPLAAALLAASLVSLLLGRARLGPTSFARRHLYALGGLVLMVTLVAFVALPWWLLLLVALAAAAGAIAPRREVSSG